ncbi:MAG: UbiA family prenyltransferase [candidate division Zixibacteria bacterium]|nr:UbiA family prenyltransferase [candidate division Zixibacteria bacterium]MDH3938535.1 UbiA family prenyltransferase [candidate division Zixibacteria bacterium]MDH4035123.1 UbiA family prenyltransferase [candidate division Zixibacteria bacterium]
MKLIDYFFAARPLLHLPVWSVYLVSLYHYHQNLGESFNLWHLGTMFCLSLMAAGAFYVNQIYDYESDLLNDKLGFLQRDLTSPRGFITAYLICAVLGAAFAAVVSRLMLLIFLEGFVVAWLYSAPPFRLKDRPMSGLLANAWCFGFLIPLAVLPPIGLYHYFRYYWVWPCYFFLTVASVHIMTTLPDRAGDAATDKRTVAVVLSPVTAKSIALILMLASAALAWWNEQAVLVYLSVFSSLPILVSLGLNSQRLGLLAAKLPLLLLTLLAGYYYPGYLLFVVALVVGCRIYFHKTFGIVYPKLD